MRIVLTSSRGSPPRQVRSGGVPPAEEVAKVKGFNVRDERLMVGNRAREPNAAVIDDFMHVLALCHTVIPEGEPTEEGMTYQVTLAPVTRLEFCVDLWFLCGYVEWDEDRLLIGTTPSGVRNVRGIYAICNYPLTLNPIKNPTCNH